MDARVQYINGEFYILDENGQRVRSVSLDLQAGYDIENYASIESMYGVWRYVWNGDDPAPPADGLPEVFEITSTGKPWPAVDSDYTVGETRPIA